METAFSEGRTPRVQQEGCQERDRTNGMEGMEREIERTTWRADGGNLGGIFGVGSFRLGQWTSSEIKSAITSATTPQAR